MKLLIESALIFFATLLAAALVALGEPRSAARPYLAVPQGNAAAPMLDAVRPERITALQP